MDKPRANLSRPGSPSQSAARSPRLRINTDYVCIGGNRHPAAADWDRHFTGNLTSNLNLSMLGGCRFLAYGADNGIALWDPLDLNCRGVSRFLTGLHDRVNAVKFFRLPSTAGRLPSGFLIIAGSTSGELRVWYVEDAPADLLYGEGEEPRCVWHTCAQTASAVNALDVLQSRKIFVSASANSSVIIWDITWSFDKNSNFHIAQSERIWLKMIPLAVALAALSNSTTLLTVAGTHSIIYVYVSDGAEFTQVAMLAGHCGWIRALAIHEDSKGFADDLDLLLASGSQDKSIRLWRIHRGKALPKGATLKDGTSTFSQSSPASTKPHWFHGGGQRFSVTFEALLLGHEDWIYTVSWDARNDSPRLLSASADNSLAIWEADAQSGIWLCTVRLGEVSAQKGSTTATGSTGGFWLGMWSPNGKSVVSLARSGSWRLWTHADGVWRQRVGIGGHTKAVKDLSWSSRGDYLLSASQDQTSRLHAEWKSSHKNVSWHEFARPQIHGYGLNCIAAFPGSYFVSAADEKPVRVFQEPQAVAEILEHACGIRNEIPEAAPDAADIPVLGLSNKAVHNEVGASALNQKFGHDYQSEAVEVASRVPDVNSPPLEEQLSRHLLWPETQKLYGHGFEIACVASNNAGTYLASASRASSIDYAVIRVFSTANWREACAPLKAHTLTVTDMEWSSDDQYLLSVSRDRTWCVFRQSSTGIDVNPFTAKGHSRMILGCSWAPLSSGRVFATAGRDKAIKLWTEDRDREGFACRKTFSFDAPVTAIAFRPQPIKNHVWLASGLENGAIHVSILSRECDIESMTICRVDAYSGPTKSICCLSWRPFRDSESVKTYTECASRRTPAIQLAVASEDSSVRIYTIQDYSAVANKPTCT